MKPSSLPTAACSPHDGLAALHADRPLRRPLLQGELVGNHGDELAITVATCTKTGGKVMVFSSKLWNFQRVHCANQSAFANLSRYIITYVYRGFGLQFSFIPLHNRPQVLLHPLHHALRRDDGHVVLQAKYPAIELRTDGNRNSHLKVLAIS